MEIRKININFNTKINTKDSPLCIIKRFITTNRLERIIKMIKYLIEHKRSIYNILGTLKCVLQNNLNHRERNCVMVMFLSPVIYKRPYLLSVYTKFSNLRTKFFF